MAKDKKKKGGGKKDGRGGPGDAVEAVRTAVERTFMATAEGAQITRDRAQELVDEITSAANRVREALEELDLVEELRGLRADVEKLARRVTALEPSGGGAAQGGGTDVADAPPAPKGASAKPSAKRAASKAGKGAKRAPKRPAKASGTTVTAAPPGVDVPDIAAPAALATETARAGSAKAAKSGAKRAAKGAKESAKGSAKSGAKGSAKESAKGSAKDSAKGSAKSGAKESAKAAAKGSSKRAAKGSAKSSATAGTAVAGGTAKAAKGTGSGGAGKRRASKAAPARPTPADDASEGRS
jgi:hypothetical protein